MAKKNGEGENTRKSKRRPVTPGVKSVVKPTQTRSPAPRKPVAAPKQTPSPRTQNAVSDEPQKDEDNNFVVYGQVMYADNKPAVGVEVVAFDLDVASEDKLGTALADAHGHFSIAYTAAQFKRSAAERGGPELIVRVYDKNGNAIGQSRRINNAARTTELNVDLDIETQRNSLETRVNVLHSVLTDKAQQQAVARAVQEAKGDWTVARASLKDKLPPETLKKLDLANNLADWAGDNIPVVTALANKPDVSSLRDVALRFNVDKLAAVIDPKAVPDTTAGNTPEEKQRNFAVSLSNKLFLTETSAVLQRMAQDAELPIADMSVRSNVATLLGNVPVFNIPTA